MVKAEIIYIISGEGDLALGRVVIRTHQPPLSSPPSPPSLHTVMNEVMARLKPQALKTTSLKRVYPLCVCTCMCVYVSMCTCVHLY